jgi:uncharacterized membrane protein required for colicin V production
MFNLIDVVVILVIGLSAFIGYKRGFVKTAISLLSFFIAIGVALMFYKPLALVLTEKTEIDDWIIAKVENGRTIEEPEEAVEESEDKEKVVEIKSEAEKEASIESVLEDLPQVVIASETFQEAKKQAMHEAALKISELSMNILSLIAIFVIVKVTLFVVSILLGGVMKLPVLKQMNEVLGLAFGAIMGIVEMYIAFAGITFISSVADISFVVDAIKTSLIGGTMFENNLIINFLF